MPFLFPYGRTGKAEELRTESAAPQVGHAQGKKTSGAVTGAPQRPRFKPQAICPNATINSSPICGQIVPETNRVTEEGSEARTPDKPLETYHRKRPAWRTPDRVRLARKHDHCFSTGSLAACMDVRLYWPQPTVLSAVPKAVSWGVVLIVAGLFVVEAVDKSGVIRHLAALLSGRRRQVGDDGHLGLRPRARRRRQPHEQSSGRSDFGQRGQDDLLVGAVSGIRGP